MLARFRNGCLTTIRRKDGVGRWLFRWRERCTDGTLRERNKVIGTVEEYPTKSKKLHEAVTRLRVNINTDGPTELTSITMAKAVDHYTVHELADCGAEGKAYSTRSRKTHLLSRWVVPHWGKVELRAIKTVAVEQWLKTLVTTKFGKPKLLAGGTREKIRDAMSSIFNHANRWELSDRNPSLVRQNFQECTFPQRENVHLTFSKSKRCNCFWQLLVSGSGPCCFSTCHLGSAEANWLG